ncbi:MAG: putative transcriptional regulator YvhJ [bacterium ADurb.Bin212]|nr:MAG: putative transcriptional regulator YvhJ [bacterium ADurb.Bin212]
MFLKKKKKTDITIKEKKPVKKWKRVLLIIFLSLFVVIAALAAYIYATGYKIFDSGNLTASPFFKKISGQEYKLRGEGDGRINVVMLGMGGANHPGGTLTDSIMVISLNPEEKSFAMLSIPRDLYVPIPGTKYSRKINEVYKIGEDKKDGSGGEFAKEAIGAVLDLPIHYYVTVDFYGFVKVVDSVGGLVVDVDKALYDPLFPDDDMKGYNPFYVKAGSQKMNGTTALKYARSRQTSSDFDRAARQQKVIEALRNKLSESGYLTNPKNLVSLLNIVSDHLRTDFTPDEVVALAGLVKDMDFSKTVSKVLSNGADGELVSDSSSGTYVLMPKGGDWSVVQRVAHEIFTDPDLKKESAKIEVLNGTSVAGQAGKLAETLKSYNYNVVSIATGDAVAKTSIIDYSDGKNPITISFLEKRLGVKAVQKSKEKSSASVDISILIGDDYKGFAKELSSE